MFEEYGEKITQTKEIFSELVEDTFGDSINIEVFDEITKNIYSLETIYNQAELQIQEIKLKTVELRSII